MAVIGDGAITGGMAFEAMNCAGYLGVRHMVILNDNGQVNEWKDSLNGKKRLAQNSALLLFGCCCLDVFLVLKINGGDWPHGCQRGERERSHCRRRRRCFVGIDDISRLLLLPCCPAVLYLYSI